MSLDPDLFTDKKIKELDKFAKACVEATTADAIVKMGAELDKRRADNRDTVRLALARNKALNEFYKQLIFQVPRRTNVDGEQEAVVE